MKNLKNINLYRPCVGIMLVNQKSEVFVAQRIDIKSDAWQMPQGGVDKGEELTNAALRELKEEIGTNQVKVLHEYDEWLFYDLPETLRYKLWGGEYVGQRQKWFLMRYLGNDIDINIETPTPEFNAWKWVSPEILPDLAIAFKKDIYRKLLRVFAPFLKK